jgi:hypothetical protein
VGDDLHGTTGLVLLEGGSEGDEVVVGTTFEEGCGGGRFGRGMGCFPWEESRDGSPEAATLAVRPARRARGRIGPVPCGSLRRARGCCSR